MNILRYTAMKRTMTVLLRYQKIPQSTQLINQLCGPLITAQVMMRKGNLREKFGTNCRWKKVMKYEKITKPIMLKKKHLWSKISAQSKKNKTASILFPNAISNRWSARNDDGFAKMASAPKTSIRKHSYGNELVNKHFHVENTFKRIESWNFSPESNPNALNANEIICDALLACHYVCAVYMLCRVSCVMFCLLLQLNRYNKYIDTMCGQSIVVCVFSALKIYTVWWVVIIRNHILHAIIGQTLEWHCQMIHFRQHFSSFVCRSHSKTATQIFHRTHSRGGFIDSTERRENKKTNNFHLMRTSERTNKRAMGSRFVKTTMPNRSSKRLY